MAGHRAGQVAVVTDSTAYLSEEMTGTRRITVVPLQVIVGGTVCDEGTEIAAAQVADALQRSVQVTTSRPSPQRFFDAYSSVAASGASGILSIHLSSDMSGTIDAARMASTSASIPVRVVDARSIGLGLGFPVLAAAEAAADGCGLVEAAEIAERRAATGHSLFYLDTLEHLRRGGRIGPAAKFLGSALMMKPLLHVVDGRIAPLEKVRTAARAIARLEELSAQRAGNGPVDIAVQHLANRPRADALAQRLRERVPNIVDMHVGEVGAVIGAHVGPGMLGVVVSPR